MIKKLKIKFIALAMAALVSLLCVIVIGMNLINYDSVVEEADTILSVLSKNKGTFPELAGDKNNRGPGGMSPETPYESRFFSVFLNESYNVVNTDTSRIISIDRESAIRYAEKVIESEKAKGFIGEYRYIFKSEANGYRITFLDCGRKLDSFSRFLKTSIWMSAIGLSLMFAVIFILSGKIIKPIAESYKKQKQFITDAGHEIKTPLTIINANLDIMEMEFGEQESISDMYQQVKRLKSLTNDLVLLARMEEAETSIQKIEFPVSEVVSEAALPFRTLAVQQGKEFTCEIQPMLTLKGNDRAIQQLISILMENALKYSPAGGTVALRMMKQNRNIHITVFNTTETEIEQEQLVRVFDRFYRAEASRNSETGGHGIGLSVAKAIVAAHDGRIQASTQDSNSNSFQISVTLPV